MQLEPGSQWSTRPPALQGGGESGRRIERRFYSGSYSEVQPKLMASAKHLAAPSGTTKRFAKRALYVLVHVWIPHRLTGSRVTPTHTGLRRATNEAKGRPSA